MLSIDTLKSSLRPFFNGSTMPNDAISAWTKAYADYASSAIAGGCLPTPLVPQSLPGDFYDSLDSSIRAMWMSTVWVGPGLTGTTLVVPPLQPALQSLIPSLIISFDTEQALSAIASAIHTYTLSITVMIVTPAGVSTVVPIV